MLVRHGGGTREVRIWIWHDVRLTGDGSDAVCGTKITRLSPIISFFGVLSIIKNGLVYPDCCMMIRCPKEDRHSSVTNDDLCKELMSWLST